MPYKDPEKRRAYAREYQRLQRAGVSQTPGKTPLPTEFRLQTAREAIDLLREQIEAVRRAKVKPTERARCIGYLAAIVLKAIEVAEVEARIEALEQVIQERGFHQEAA